MRKEVCNPQNQGLTPPENAAIIVSLCAAEAKEKKTTRQIVAFQATIALVSALLAYSLSGAMRDAVAVFSGGVVSVLNGVLLAWRMSRVALHPAHDAHHPNGVHRQLRLMYFCAAERFLAVVVLLGLCIVSLKKSELTVLGGFVAGQAALLVGRLFLNRLN